MVTQHNLKMALDELRMLMMGAQLLFGFQFHAAFENASEKFGPVERGLLTAATMLQAVTVAILIAGPCYHRIVEQGAANDRVLRTVTGLATCALMPIALSLGCDFTLVTRQTVGSATSWLIGGAMVAAAVGLWYVAALSVRWIKETPMPKAREEHVPLITKIDQMLTESRVIIPGAQAVLGFQLIAMLTDPFATLPALSKSVHLASMIAVGLSVILLMGTAALHRLGFGGEAKPEMLDLGTGMVTAALLPLGLGIAGDVFVALERLTQSVSAGAMGGVAILLIELALWYVWPVTERRRRKRAHAR